jgi:hypothetical protein
VGTALADSGAIATGAWTEWDVTPAVTGEGDVSFRLASAVSDGVNFHSRDSATVNRRPELILTVRNDFYPRPRAASTQRLPLVPAFSACTSPNRTHGPPLASPSCNPPVQSSPRLTVGTQDSNGQASNSAGNVKVNAIAGVASTPADEADVRVALTLSDVRTTANLGDYAGELRIRSAFRITDRANGPGHDEPATTQELDIPVNASCATTPDPATGSTCGVVTTLDAVVPGTVDEASRSVWEIGQIEVLDGGPDGDADTPDNSVFARQGLFVP